MDTNSKPPSTFSVVVRLLKRVSNCVPVAWSEAGKPANEAGRLAATPDAAGWARAAGSWWPLAGSAPSRAALEPVGELGDWAWLILNEERKEEKEN
jgi:hypothetical protein